MGDDATARYCRCGTYLSRANMGVECASCERLGDRDQGRDVPLDFWEHPHMRGALTSRHMGRIIRAYRNHPFHGRRCIPQEVVASWGGVTQAQLSRIETSRMTVVDIDRLSRWADALRIPSAFLWFIREGSDQVGVEDVGRSDFLRLTGVALATAGAVAAGRGVRRVFTQPEAAQWLASELWSRKASAIHHGECPVEMAASLSVHAAGAGIILRDRDGFFSFAHRAFVDFYLAQSIFISIAAGDQRPFATAQTSHETDLVIRNFVERDGDTVGRLTQWMSTGRQPVLRVNSAGVLAKIGATQADPVIHSLLSDDRVRQLYLTAVASRVLDTAWEDAEHLAAKVQTSSIAQELSNDTARMYVDRFRAEIRNPRDVAARWCSVVWLSQLQSLVPDFVNQTLQQALSEETSVLTLRTIGSVLGGNNPIAH